MRKSSLFVFLLHLFNISLSMRCASKRDIVFILDESGSIFPEQYQTAKAFLKQIVNEIAVGIDESWLSLVRYSDDVTIYMKNEIRPTVFARKIDEMVQKRSFTNTGTALDTTITKVAGSLRRNFDDLSAMTVFILITDGVTSQNDVDNLDRAIKRMNRVLTKNFLSIAVGVGDQTNITELERIASGKDFVFQTTFEGILGILGAIENKTCSKPIVIGVPLDSGDILTSEPFIVNKGFITYLKINLTRVSENGTKAVSISVKNNDGHVTAFASYWEENPNPEKHDFIISSVHLLDTIHSWIQLGIVGEGDRNLFMLIIETNIPRTKTQSTSRLLSSSIQTTAFSNLKTTPDDFVEHEILNIQVGFGMGFFVEQNSPKHLKVNFTEDILNNSIAISMDISKGNATLYGSFVYEHPNDKRHELVMHGGTTQVVVASDTMVYLTLVGNEKKNFVTIKIELATDTSIGELPLTFLPFSCLVFLCLLIDVVSLLSVTVVGF